MSTIIDGSRSIMPDAASKMPARIRVEQDADGFWTCREAISGSPEYVRADIVERLAEALARSVIAIDDWLHQYAPDECAPKRVTETRDRIMSGGGTLAYIAGIQQQNRSALTSYREASNDK